MSPDTALQEARQLAAAGQWSEVCQRLRAVVQLHPHHPGVLHMLGTAYQHCNEPGSAVTVFRQLLAMQPENVRSRTDLAGALMQAGDSGAALELLLSIPKQRRGAEVSFSLAQTLKMLGRTVESIEPMEQALRSNPENAGWWVTLGDACKSVGDIEQAAAHYRQAMAVRPGWGVPWWALSNLKTAPVSWSERRKLQKLAQSAGTEDLVFFEFAQARALEDHGKYDKAFEHFRRGNELRRQQMPWDGAAFSDWLRRTTDAQLQAGAPPRPGLLPSPRPVFIVSLPRSGSTLTEQILAAHPDVTAASELPWLPRLVAGESQQRRAGLDQWALKASAQDWSRLGSAYLERASWWYRDTPVFTDKLPGNHAYIGAILNMLPQALMVIVHRGALDVCVSNYRQLFISGNEFSYDLEDLASYWHDFERATTQWEQAMPERVLGLRYEDLVSAPEPEVRRLLEFLDLPWDERCLHPEDADRAVNTASAAQVRQGISTGGIEAWRRYEAHLGKLISAVEAG